MQRLFNFVPGFWTGLIAAGIAVSALLVLYFLKLRRREMPVSSTILWRKAVQDLQVNAPFQKLRKNLLLLLQLLLLALLCFALMRPAINNKATASELTVLLIDRSASMAAKDVDGGKRTRLEEAKRRANDLIDSMKRGDNVCVIAFDETAETLCPLTPDAQKARVAINSIEQTDRRSRLKLAYQLAEAQSSFIPEQNRENVRPDVFLYSDGRTLDSTSLTLRGNLTYERIGEEKTDNVAIVAMSAKRNYENPTEVQVFARLANYGAEVVDADVNLLIATEFNPNPNFRVSNSAQVTLFPDRWDENRRNHAEKEGRTLKDSVEFRLNLTSGAALKLEQQRKDGDQLAADDTAQVIVPPPKQLSVLLVSDGNFYLDKLKGSIQGLKDFDILTPPAYEEQKPTKYDVIIFDRHPPKYLPLTGNFMYFRDTPPDKLKIKPAVQQNKPVYVKENTVIDWKREHPMLRGMPPLTKVYVENVRRYEFPVGVERLVEGSKGPLVLLSREGRSNHLVVAFDVLDSNWPLKLSFPVFMYQALQYLALGSEMDVREAFAPGATPVIPLADVKRVAGDSKEIRINGPTGSKRIRIPDAGDFVVPALDRVGIYTLDVPVPGYDKMAVNLLDGSESNLVPLATNEAPGGVGDSV